MDTSSLEEKEGCREARSRWFELELYPGLTVFDLVLLEVWSADLAWVREALAKHAWICVLLVMISMRIEKCR